MKTETCHQVTDSSDRFKFWKHYDIYGQQIWYL